MGYEKDITLCKPLHAILTERSKEDFRFGSLLCLLIARGEETEHYKIKQPIRQKSPLFFSPLFCPRPNFLDALVRKRMLSRLMCSHFVSELI